MNSLWDKIVEAVVGKSKYPLPPLLDENSADSQAEERSNLHRERMIDKNFVEQMYAKMESESRLERSIGRRGLVQRASSDSTPTVEMTRSVERGKQSKYPSAELDHRPRISPPPPPPTPTLEPLSRIHSLKTSALFLDTSLPPPRIDPSNSVYLPNFISPSFPSPPKDKVGYGRYRHDKDAPREAILAHIDSQIGAISDLLTNSTHMPKSNIPGYDDITFGDRLQAKRTRELDRAHAALKPSTEVTPDGMTIHRGFPGAESLIIKGATRGSYDHAPTGAYSCGKIGFFNPMTRPDKKNCLSLERIGFTHHPLPAQSSPVRRKWTELEKLKPRGMTQRAAERNLREQRAAAVHGAMPILHRGEDGAAADNNGMNEIKRRIEAAQRLRMANHDNDGNETDPFENAILSTSSSANEVEEKKTQRDREAVLDARRGTCRARRVTFVLPRE